MPYLAPAIRPSIAIGGEQLVVRFEENAAVTEQIRDVDPVELAPAGRPAFAV